MILTIHNTTKVVDLYSGPGNSVPARIWEGFTESGIPVHCYITRVAVKHDEDTSEFERELEEQRPPSADVEAIPGADHVAKLIHFLSATPGMDVMIEDKRNRFHHQ
jgi:hypothetical protein